jgi:hypothetical protein
MSERFLKFIPSEAAFWLMTHKPNAFRLLTHIANTARRTYGCPEGLSIGECRLLNWKNYNFTEQQYRTAKKILVDLKHIKIIETCRTRQKSTTGVTTGSTLVRLISSTIYDINSEEINDRINDRATTDQRPTCDFPQEIKKDIQYMKKEKKDKNKQPLTPSFPISKKIKFRENVELSQVEYDSLLAKHGADFFGRMLDVLDSYKGSSGKQYKSDYHTMKAGGWVTLRVEKDILTTKPSGQNEKAERSSSSSAKPAEPRYQPNRVLRGSNDIEGNKRPVHE